MPNFVTEDSNMAQFNVNFHSYSIGYPIQIEVTIPSVSSCDGRDGSPVTHELPAKFPVLYLLHGAGNDYHCWTRYTSAERYAEEQMIAIVTCSVGNSAYMNREDVRGENYYDFVSKELPEFLANYFPISTRPEDSYIAGYSMGGFGTMLHTFTTPERFTASGFFSIGVMKNAPSGSNRPDVIELAKKAKETGKLPKIFLCCGKEDFLYAAAVELHNELDKRGIEHRYDEEPGYEHEFAFWDLELQKFLAWIPRTDYYADKVPHKI